MPSKHMVRYPIDFYPNQSHQIEQLVLDEDIKRARFLRECVLQILKSPIETRKVVKECRTVNYKRNGHG
ncbi:MAG: hypothetical protein CMP95_01515 [Gammaproteobacteria bacterium]|nr:hypothetical protein [Gammaproteobacteria bacterium]